MNSILRLDHRDGAYFLTLNRPESGNCLSAALVESVHDALDRVEGEGARALVIQGEGRNFCTGFDLGDISETTDSALLLRFIRIEQLLARIWSAEFATIAVARGRSFGAGADLFASCSTRIAIDGSTFCFPGSAFGLVLGTRRLAERVGTTNAQRYVTSGGLISAEEAAAVGLASHIASEIDADIIIASAVADGRRLDSETFVSIRRALGAAEGLDQDLAALVRSAARPGLQQRIIAYRSRTSKGHQGKVAAE